MPWKTVRVRSVSKAWPYVNLCMHAYVYFAICLTTALTPYPTEFGMLIGGQWESVIGSTDSDGTLPTLQQRWNEALLRCMLTRHMENWSKRGFQARGLVQNQSSRGMGDEDDELIVVPRSRMQQDDGFTSSSIKKAGWLYYQSNSLFILTHSISYKSILRSSSTCERSPIRCSVWTWTPSSCFRI